MNSTKHASFRSIQRNLDNRLAEIAVKEGKELKFNRDRILVTEEIARSLRLNPAYPRKLVNKVEKAAPFVCVVKDDVVITMFRANQRLNRRFAGNR